MKPPSKPEDSGPPLREKIIGMGERSIRKSYYPQLQRQLEEAEHSRRQLEEKSAALLNMLEDLEQARGRLADSQSRYRLLVENINDVIFSLDLKGTVTYISPVIQTFGGLKPEQVVGVPFKQLVHPDDQAAVAIAFQHVLAGDREPWEFRIIGREGTQYHARTSARPLEEEGRVVGLTGIISDVTERRAAETRLRELNRDLERRVSERTAQLEGANKELEAFAYSVSHDLRAPLRHIDGFVGLLMKKIAAPTDEQSRQYMDRISEAVRRMETLIEDLLSFSRMGRAEVTRTQVDLGGLVQEVIPEFEQEARGRVIDWHVGPLPVVMGDGAMLRVVFVNLISNAVKFTQPRERAEIEIGCAPEQAENEIVIFVRDNGVGFDMKYADKLFGVFQRLHTPEEFEGTGIGLATVQRIIARHDGRIWAEGKVDGGATFYFTMPQQRKV